MRHSSRVIFAFGCISLVALNVPAFGRPSPRDVDAGQTHARKDNHAHKDKHKVKARHETARLVSMRVEQPPERPLFGWPALVTEARKYLGTNPTGQKKLWCARFMNLVLGKLGYAGTHSDAAKSFATYGHRISEPKVGAIAVLTRGKNGGHVGVVTGIDKDGNPIIVSGNHGHSVGEAVYSRARVIAYVMPSDSPHPTQLASRGTSDRPSDLVIDSPITELLKAIEAEQSEAKAVPVTPPAPAVPHRVVQQTAQAVAAPAQEPQRASTAARRDLPLDPRLARILGINDGAKSAQPAKPAPVQRQQRVEQNASDGPLAALFSARSR